MSSRLARRSGTAGLPIHRTKRGFSCSSLVAAETLTAPVIAPRTHAALRVLTAPDQADFIDSLQPGAKVNVERRAGCEVAERVRRQLAAGNFRDVFEPNRCTGAL